MLQPEISYSPDTSAGYVLGERSPTWPGRATLEKFFAMCPSALAIWDLDGRIRHVNCFFERLIGYGIEEMEGLSIFDFAHPDDRAAAVAEFRTLLAVGEITGYECRSRC